MVPFVISNRMTYEPNEFVKSKTFAYADSKIPSTLTDKAQRSAFVFETFNQAELGETGLSDMEAGVLYNWVTNDTLIFSTGVGMRFPTGKSYAPRLLRPIGKGFYVAAVRNNLDFSFLEKNLWLSLEHQVETLSLIHI